MMIKGTARVTRSAMGLSLFRYHAMYGTPIGFVALLFCRCGTGGSGYLDHSIQYLAPVPIAIDLGEPPMGVTRLMA